MREEDEIRIRGRCADAERIHIDHRTRIADNADAILCVDCDTVSFRTTHDLLFPPFMMPGSAESSG
jgi:hypothetical protein